MGPRVLCGRMTRGPLRMPDPDDLPGRLRSVLQVLCLMLNEGFVATTGPAVSRPTSPTRRSA